MTFEKHVIARMILCMEMKMSDPSTLATVSPSLTKLNVQFWCHLPLFKDLIFS